MIQSQIYYSPDQILEINLQYITLEFKTINEIRNIDSPADH